MRDYEVLRRELPNDNEIAENLFHAQVALKKSRGEEVYNMKFGGEVEEISGLEQFRAAISSPGKLFNFHIGFAHTSALLSYRVIKIKILNCRSIRCLFQNNLQCSM